MYNLCMHAKSLQLCPTLCNPMDCSPPGTSVLGILQARILEWVAVPSSRRIFISIPMSIHKPISILIPGPISIYLPTCLSMLVVPILPQGNALLKPHTTWDSWNAYKGQTGLDPVRPQRWQPPGSASLGFSRQEHWSGLAFPTPVQESEK